MQNIRQMTPTYLNMAMMNCLSSNIALQLAKQESLLWKQELKTEAEILLENITDNDYAEIQKQLLGISNEHFQKVLGGIEKLWKTPYQRPGNSQDVVWQEGSTRVYEYKWLEPSGQSLVREEKGTILFIPSLINKSYIFDLSEQHSMINFFQSECYRCLLVDWGDPSDDEKDFSVDDYVIRLGNALEDLGAKLDTKMSLVGYCMGGMIALACAQLYKNFIQNITLIATPWDFMSADIKRVVLSQVMKESLDNYIKSQQEISGEWVHQVMYMVDPWSVHDKYARYFDMDDDSDEAAFFIEREYWLHDSTPLTSNVAKQIFIDWAVDNNPIMGKWAINGEVIDPQKIEIPVLLAISKSDKIVPPLCTSPLSILLENAEIIYPKTGHIGMVAGMNAEINLWSPLAKWLEKG